MEIIFNDKTPIYQQIMSQVKSQIASGNIKPGEKVPSIRELSKMLQTNPNTIIRSYKELEREGLIINKRGEGAFVTEVAGTNLKQSMAQEYINEFIANMKRLNISPAEIKAMIKEALQ